MLSVATLTKENEAAVEDTAGQPGSTQQARQQGSTGAGAGAGAGAGQGQSKGQGQRHSRAGQGGRGRGRGRGRAWANSEDILAHKTETVGNPNSKLNLGTSNPKLKAELVVVNNGEGEGGGERGGIPETQGVTERGGWVTQKSETHIF